MGKGRKGEPAEVQPAELTDDHVSNSSRQVKRSERSAHGLILLSLHGHLLCKFRRFRCTLPHTPALTSALSLGSRLAFVNPGNLERATGRSVGMWASAEGAAFLT